MYILLYPGKPLHVDQRTAEGLHHTKMSSMREISFISRIFSWIISLAHAFSLEEALSITWGGGV